MYASVRRERASRSCHLISCELPRARSEEHSLARRIRRKLIAVINYATLAGLLEITVRDTLYRYNYASLDAAP